MSRCPAKSLIEGIDIKIVAAAAAEAGISRTEELRQSADQLRLVNKLQSATTYLDLAAKT